MDCGSLLRPVTLSEGLKGAKAANQFELQEVQHLMGYLWTTATN